MSLLVFLRSLVFLAGVILLGACSQPAASIPPTPTRTLVWTVVSPTLTKTLSKPTVEPTKPPVVSTSIPFTPTPMPGVCSPLQGYSLQEIDSIVTNPYNPPAAGSDDPHQGVDLADRLPGSLAAVSGLDVHSILAGQVAAVIVDRFPYGNAVLVETPLQAFPIDWFPAGYLPEPVSQPLVNPALTCPVVSVPTAESPNRSIYILYAHMQSQPDVSLGQDVQCGQGLGSIGDSGNALNPHLHVEVRLGPSGVRFNSLAHYDNRATQEEMGLYCLWRVSGFFQVLDPMVIFAIQP